MADAETGAVVAPETPPARLSFRAVAATLALCLLAIEGLCHMRLVPLSSEYRECWSFPERASALQSRPGFKIAVVGNSAARMGVDLEALARDVNSRTALTVAADRFSLDGSRVTIWRYILERAFIRPNLRPDAVVILFQPGALEDGGEVIPPLAQGLTTVADWPEVWNSHLRDPGDRSEFVLDSVSAAYASRSRLRDKTLHRLVPRYQEFASDLNGAAYALKRIGRPGDSGRNPTYFSLRATLAAARRHGLRLVFALYPEYETDQATRERCLGAISLLRESGFDFLDLSRCPDLTPDRYVDKFHLDPVGEAIFTRALAAALSPLVKGRPAGTRPL